MPNRTRHIVGGGTRTQAKDEYLRLAAQRDPQILMAMKHVECNKGITMDVTKMKDDDPQRVIFLSVMEEFRAARAVKSRTGKVLKGAIHVAAEAATKKNKPFFDDKATAEAALAASQWAQEALYWAGNQLYRSNTQPSSAAPVKSPTTVPNPMQVFGKKPANV